MNVSQEDARESLVEVRTAAEHTRRAVASTRATYSGDVLILWGVIWIVGFTILHLQTAWASYVFAALSAAGLIATVVWVSKKLPTRAPVRSAVSMKMFWRIFWFWALLNPYVFAWLLILSPDNKLQVCAFLCTVGMFGFSMLGLWFEKFFILGLGLAVTTAILLSYLLAPSSFYLLMIPTGGGTMLGTGLYFRLRWR